MKQIGTARVLVLAAATAACGGTPEGEEPGGETIASESSALSWSGPRFWRQGELSKGLGHVSNSVCFLTQVQGRFAGDGEEVGIYGVSPGAWHLGGKSQQTNVGAGATCIIGITTNDYTNTQYWYQGDEPVALGRWVNGSFVQVDADWSCFLTVMGGAFEGYGEEIRTTFSDGKWWLTGKSQHQGVKAGAQCVRKPRGTTYTIDTLQDGMGIGVDPWHDACFLRRVSGLFHADQYVILYPVDGWWIFEIGRLFDPPPTEEIRASASCVL